MSTPAEFFRKKEHQSWNDTPLVLGFEVRLSATSKNDARCGLCKQMAGKYPKWFLWTGWHEGCICFKVPILMSREMLDRYNKLIARGKDTPDNVARLQRDVMVTGLPVGFRTWVKENVISEGNLERYPHWITENFDDIPQLMQYI